MVDMRPNRRKASSSSSALEPIVLPAPAFKRSGPLARIWQRRRTIREVSDRDLPLRTVADLLWAACGVNRRKGPFGTSGRTAASASNSQEIELYVALAQGTYLYDPLRHRLLPVVTGDLRPLAIGRGQRRIGDRAPVRLIYVADIDKLVHTGGYQEPGLRDADIQRSYYYVDTGLIAANVYLFAASADLAAWFHNCDRSRLHAQLHLRADQRVLFGQTIGYPLKKRRGGAR